MNQTDHYPATPIVTAGTLPAAGNASAICWGAILAGAAAAAALSLVLLVLGAGLGLSAVSPWSFRGIGAPALGIAGVLWLTFTQLAASGMGGYLAGRLRTRWVGTHADEVYFRDTAHGFLAWGVASLATAALLSSVTAGILGTGAQAAGAVAGGAATTSAAAVASGATAAPGGAGDGRGVPGSAYFIDSMFRSGAAGPSASPGTAPAGGTATTAAMPSAAFPAAPAQGPARQDNGEVSRIFASGIAAGGALPAEDARYVAQMVAQRTGIPQAEAEQRVSAAYSQLQAKLRDAEAKAKDAADKARKAAALTALWLAMSLFVGAFIASLAAIWGGRARDTVVVTL